MRGVKEQIKVNREEEKKKQMEEMKANSHHLAIKASAEENEEETTSNGKPLTLDELKEKLFQSLNEKDHHNMGNALRL